MFLCHPQTGAHRARPKKTVFEDELPSWTLLGTKKPAGSIPGGHRPRPHPVPDLELMYPAVSSEREWSCYGAVPGSVRRVPWDLQRPRRPGRGSGLLSLGVGSELHPTRSPLPHAACFPSSRYPKCHSPMKSSITWRQVVKHKGENMCERVLGYIRS